MKKLCSTAVMLSSVAMFGCASSSVIKNVEDKPVGNLHAADKSKPIQFAKVVVKLKRGEHVGASQVGILCLPQGELTWKGGRVSVDSDEFTEAFKDELEKYSFKTVGDTNALFEDPSTWKSEVLVAGLVKELKTNICFPMAGFGNYRDAKGEAFMKVDWQIYSKLDRSVVHSVTTEGSFSATESTASGGQTAIVNAFSQAARNLLADSKFREIVSRGGEAVKETVMKSAGDITISSGKSKPVSGKPSEWPEAVVTVFAGRGHGSGFVISENLILTNEHVVRDANSVVIKLHSGFETTGTVLASNSGRDVALIKVDGKLPKNFLLEKDLPSVGSDVYAIGSPLNESLGSTMTKGIVSSYREEFGKKLLQSDVNIRPGNSGGPLVDKSGKVVAVAVSGLVKNNVSQGINFFIPIGDALSSLGAVY